MVVPLHQLHKVWCTILLAFWKCHYLLYRVPGLNLSSGNLLSVEFACSLHVRMSFPPGSAVSSHCPKTSWLMNYCVWNAPCCAWCPVMNRFTKCAFRMFLGSTMTLTRIINWIIYWRWMNDLLASTFSKEALDNRIQHKTRVELLMGKHHAGIFSKI